MKDFIYFASLIVLAASATFDNNMAFLHEMDRLGLINLPQNIQIVTMKQISTRHTDSGISYPSGDFQFTLNNDGANCDIVFSQDIHTHTWPLAPMFIMPLQSVVSDGCGIATQIGKAVTDTHVFLHAATR